MLKDFKLENWIRLSALGSKIKPKYLGDEKNLGRKCKALWKIYLKNLR